MFRVLKAFAWMRWRVLLNSLEQTGARDRLERMSLALEQIGPIIALLLIAPSAIGLAGLGGYAGYALAAGAPMMPFEALRFLLLAACGFAIVGPLLLPSLTAAPAVRLLLLPIPRGTLYAAQCAGALSEPWTLIAVVVVLSLPVGLAIGGAVPAAAISLVAGLLLIFCVVGLSTLSTLLLHLVLRDRRRGELVTLAFIFLVPMISMLPTFLMPRRDAPASAEHRTRRSTPPPAWAARTAGAAFAAVPSELFTRATRSSARQEPSRAVLPLAVLVTAGAVLHALGLMTFARLLDSPSAGTRRRSASVEAGPGIRLPFLSRASAAVARTQLRLAMRTPRGRSILLSPVAVCVLFALVRRQGQMDLGFIDLASGLSLATFGGVVSLLTIMPFALNQFAIDRAGLTLALLSPIDTGELLMGKAVGNGLIAGGAAGLVMLVAVLFFSAGSPALWLSLPPAFVAAYLLVAPGAATLSTVFPKTVDLNSAGRGTNPHGFANVLGLLLLIACGLPSVLIILVMTSLVRIPALMPIVMLAWCGVALVLSRLLFRGVAVLFDKRRENLGIVAV